MLVGLLKPLSLKSKNKERTNTMNKRNLNFADVYRQILAKTEEYLLKNNIKTVVDPISGGLDSGLTAAILSKICKKNNIKLVGRYIHIESNKQEEQDRAEMIGKAFCDDFKSLDLTPLYNVSLGIYEEGAEIANPSYADKIRRGNIKARMRMIHAFNLSSQYERGLVIDNDNMTEHLLGFWTLNGDVGTLTPLASLFKTEVFELAKYMVNEVLTDSAEKAALVAVIEAVPTDGLGITSSDVEQFGAKSYDEVDDILMTILGYVPEVTVTDIEELSKKYTKETVDKVIKRHENSEFKRNCPYRIHVDI